MNARIGPEMDSMRLQSRTPLWIRFDPVGLNNFAIEDARLIAGFFLIIATDPRFRNRPFVPRTRKPVRIDGGSLRQKRPVVALERSNNPRELVISELIQQRPSRKFTSYKKNEVNAVSGGFLPLAILAFAIGFDAGFIIVFQ
jgi:hypothetical protein